MHQTAQTKFSHVLAHQAFDRGATKQILSKNPFNNNYAKKMLRKSSKVLNQKKLCCRPLTLYIEVWSVFPPIQRQIQLEKWRVRPFCARIFFPLLPSNRKWARSACWRTWTQKWLIRPRAKLKTGVIARISSHPSNRNLESNSDARRNTSSLTT